MGDVLIYFILPPPVNALLSEMKIDFYQTTDSASRFDLWDLTDVNSLVNDISCPTVPLTQTLAPSASPVTDSPTKKSKGKKDKLKKNKGKKNKGKENKGKKNKLKKGKDKKGNKNKKIKKDKKGSRKKDKKGDNKKP